MQLVEPNVISKEEKILFHSMNAVLEPEAIRKIFLEKYKLELLQKTVFNEGDIVIHNNQVAFRLSFDAHVLFSILIDRSGRYMGLATHDNEQNVDNDAAAIQMKLMDAELIRRREKEIVNAIASPINKKQLSEIFEKENGLYIGEVVHFKGGQIISYKDKVTYKLDFNADLKISLLIDRHGGFLSFTNYIQHPNHIRFSISSGDESLDDIEDLVNEDLKKMRIAS